MTSIEKGSPVKNSFRWQEIFFNLLLALCYSYFVYINIRILAQEVKFSIVLLLAFNSYVLLLSLIRRHPKEKTTSLFDYVVTLSGTYAPLFFQGVVGGHDHIVLVSLQSVGVIISFAGLLSLNRSFGLIPANRGIVTTGMYKFVRHPLYTGYMISMFFFVLQNPSLRNFIIYVIFIIFESLRLLLEENFLSKNQEYSDYMKKVKWRIVPGIW